MTGDVPGRTFQQADEAGTKRSPGAQPAATGPEAQPAVTEPEAQPDSAGQAAQPPSAGRPAEEAADRRPSPGPSPTSRARRAAAVGVRAGRPSPRPSPVAAGDQAVSAEPAAPESSSNGASAAAVPALTEVGLGSPVSAPAGRATAEKPTTGTATAEKPTTETAPQPVELRRVRTGRQAPLWLAVLLGVLVLAGLAALTVALTLPSGAGSTGERDRALSAAKSEVPLILSYNYASFDADVAKAKAQLTGRAVTDYTTAMAQTIKPAAVKVKAVVQAQTDGAGVESVSPDGRQVTVVVFGEQKVTNTALSAPRTDLFRVRATLDLVDGHWLVSKFDQI